jgi:translocation and assembly module TamB
MSVDATITAGKSARIIVKGDAPLDAEKKFALNADGTLDLGILTPIFAAEGRSLSGQFVVNASIGGTISAPSVAGKAQLSGGDFQDFTRGLRIQDMRFTADSDGKTIRIADFSGRAGPGTIDGKATVDITAAGMPVEASLDVRNARPIANDRLTATMNGQLKLSGEIKQRLKLSGAITVNRGEITLPDKLPLDVVVLDVRRRGQGGSTEVVQAKATQTDLDVTVSTPGQFFVRGRGLDAEVQGQIHIGGADTAPNITGGFDLRRGTYALAGQTLNFTSGKVSFDGTGLRNKLDPTLDFAAQTVSGGVTATLQVTGYASQPKIQLSSMPQLPQDEILARLLFQQSAKEMSPFQLAEIAQAAASLGGIGSGFNPLGAVRNRLGLDVFSVGSQTNAAGVSETTVEAGKYVRQGVFVGAKQSQSGATQTEVKIDLTKNLKARATVDTGSNAATTQGAQQGSGNSIGLTYQFEY